MTTVVLHEEVVARTKKWLGEIPRGWRGARLNEVAAAWTSSVDKLTVDGQEPIRLCNYTDVYKNDRVTGDMAFMTATATKDEVRRFRIRRGDTIITKDSETADDIGVPAFVDYEADDLVCGYHLAIMRPKPDAVDPRFLYWVLESAPIRRQWSVLAAGVTRVGLRSSDLAKVTVPVPDMPTQGAIARFLDQETAQIDTLIAHQEELIRLAEERRRRAAETAVWRSVDPVDPGVTEPPTGWRWSRLKHVARLEAGGTPDTSEQRFWSQDSSGTPWVAIGDMSERDSVTATARRVTPAGIATKRLPIRGRGTVLFAMYASVGQVSALTEESTWNQALLGLTPDPRVMSPEYLQLVLTTLRPRLPLLYRSTTQNNLNAEQVGNLVVPVPPPELQAKIVDELRHELGQVDGLIGETRGHIALAKERRAALIAAAVTGQIDVTGKVS